MGETREVGESPEKQITRPPEKRMETFDDLRTYDKSEKIHTYDDLRNQGADRSVKTFDDFREVRGGEHKIEEIKETPETIERRRMGQAAEDIKNIDWMKPEKWKSLDVVEKRVALDHSGKALMKAYDHPNPPLFTERAESHTLGEYGNGWSYDKTAGSDYGIRMNEGGKKEINKKLFGDDPRAALETYAHEFRHSYQCEQAHSFDKGFRTDDPTKAREWSENLSSYKQPPDAELAKTNPERYFSEYEAYRNQPVEKDARDFGLKVESEVYESSYEAKER